MSLNPWTVSDNFVFNYPLQTLFRQSFGGINVFFSHLLFPSHLINAHYECLKRYISMAQVTDWIQAADLPEFAQNSRESVAMSKK